MILKSNKVKCDLIFQVLHDICRIFKKGKRHRKLIYSLISFDKLLIKYIITFVERFYLPNIAYPSASIPSAQTFTSFVPFRNVKFKADRVIALVITAVKHDSVWIRRTEGDDQIQQIIILKEKH